MYVHYRTIKTRTQKVIYSGHGWRWRCHWQQNNKRPSRWLIAHYDAIIGLSWAAVTVGRSGPNQFRAYPRSDFYLNYFSTTVTIYI